MPREVAQWILALQDFNFEVEHRSDSRMKHVDSLSRYPQDVFAITSEVEARIKVAQEKDNYNKAIAEILKLQPYENFKLKGGVVCKTMNGSDLLVVPKAMEHEVIADAHSVGHFALQKTIHTLQLQFWIPHMERKVAQLINKH